MRGFADLVAATWQQPDAGIWEVRGDAAQHVHSKVMAWLALDRALRISATHRLSKRRRLRWETARNQIADQVRTNGYDFARNSYTRAYGSHDLDAALLVLPLTGLEEPGSPRLRGTIHALRKELSAGFPLLYRYPPGQDGQHQEAAALFEALLQKGSPLGLFSEEMDPSSGALLGNYPQALTHSALVQAALALRDNPPRP